MCFNKNPKSRFSILSYFGNWNRHFKAEGTLKKHLNLQSEAQLLTELRLRFKALPPN